MSPFLRATLLVIAAVGVAGSSREKDRHGVGHDPLSCSPAYIRLSDKRIFGSHGWNGSRVLVIGCEGRLQRLTQAEKEEISKQLAAFMDRSGWTFWWRAKDRRERLQVMRSTEGYRNGNYSDFLLYDPVSGEP
jgi:hypothetical protein